MVSKLAVAALGFPRMGPHRELKFALESYWAGKSDREALLKVAANRRAEAWQLQKAAGVDILPGNDFSLYDHMLDMAMTLGVIPPRFADIEEGLERYFTMARGGEVPALEMTKWFDTNYHYLVPEFAAGQTFSLNVIKITGEILHARALGHKVRPVLVGPVSFLLLGKAAGFSPLDLLDGVLPVYAALLKTVAGLGVRWVQMDEPVLALDLSGQEQAAFRKAYKYLARDVPELKLMLTSYFAPLGDNRDLAARLPTAGLHLDLVRGAEDLGVMLDLAPADKVLSLGLINGRNIWRADLRAIIHRFRPVIERFGAERFQIAPTCSLLHVPWDTEPETSLAPEVKSWLSFAKQKLDELHVVATALSGDQAAVQGEIDAASAALAARVASPGVHVGAVRERMKSVTPAMLQRKSAFPVRHAAQQKILNLPQFPTTTIGSFPQTSDIRKARADHRKGIIDYAAYTEFLKKEIVHVVKEQEAYGLDVLVHGEPERNDMVQYFGEKLSGFAFTLHGWVQSYGSRCVRPPVIFGDISRPAAMSVAGSVYAQSLTSKPVKGMLTGPVTMLKWSFVRDDLPTSAVCRQMALALRDEVCDLEAAGIKIIQIDEPALREGLPLKTEKWDAYLAWAAECFRLCASGVRDETQIHTHMCYGEFGDIIDAIAALDADVISVEATRSRMELLRAFTDFQYPNDIGPGVYDIHSPRVPSAEEMSNLLTRARKALPDERIWVNPDCGLKTRKWEEVTPALINMVLAAKAQRKIRRPGESQAA